MKDYTEKNRSRKRSDADEIHRVLRVLFEPGDVVEVRILETRQRTVSGYFNDFDHLAAAAQHWSGNAPGVYITLNRLDPALLARAANRLKTFCKLTTADHHITRRLWLPIDVDPVRPKGVSSNPQEHDQAIECAIRVRAWLTKEFGFPQPILADSGNGAHCLAAIDLANDEPSADLVKRCLDALSSQFSNDAVSIDTGNYNAARIWKFYGTLACKGDSVPDRPHRIARLIDVPDRIEIVPVAKLEMLAALYPQSSARSEVPSRHLLRASRWFDLGEWIKRHGLKVAFARSYSGRLGRGTKWVLAACPWNAEHTDKSAFIIQFEDGRISAGCHHNGCQGNDWRALRTLLDGEREQHGRKLHENPALDREYRGALRNYTSRRRRMGW